jgi:transposase-like protein
MAKELCRTQRGEAKWRGIIRAQERSGLSVPAFCRSNKLAESTFYRWRRRAGVEPSLSRRSSRTGSASFVPVQVTDGDSSGRMEILLSDGHCVRVTPPVDGRALTEVLAVLAGVSRCGKEQRC